MPRTTVNKIVQGAREIRAIVKSHRKRSKFNNLMLYVPLTFALVAIAINQLSPDVCVDFTSTDMRKYTTVFFTFVTISIELTHSGRLLKSEVHGAELKGLHVGVHNLCAAISYVLALVFFILMADNISGKMHDYEKTYGDRACSLALTTGLSSGIGANSLVRVTLGIVFIALLFPLFAFLSAIIDNSESIGHEIMGMFGAEAEASDYRKMDDHEVHQAVKTAESGRDNGQPVRTAKHVKLLYSYHMAHFLVWAVILGLISGVFLPQFYDTKYECSNVIALHGSESNTKDVCDEAHGVSGMFNSTFADSSGTGGGRYCQINLADVLLPGGNKLSCTNLCDVVKAEGTPVKILRQVNATCNCAAITSTKKFTAADVADMVKTFSNSKLETEFVCTETLHTYMQLDNALFPNAFNSWTGINNTVAKQKHTVEAVPVLSQVPVTDDDPATGGSTPSLPPTAIVSTGSDFLKCMSDTNSNDYLDGLLPPIIAPLIIFIPSVMLVVSNGLVLAEFLLGGYGDLSSATHFHEPKDHEYNGKELIFTLVSILIAVPVAATWGGFGWGWFTAIWLVYGIDFVMQIVWKFWGKAFGEDGPDKLEARWHNRYLRKLGDHGTIHGTFLTLYASVFTIYFFSLWEKEKTHGCADTFIAAKTKPLADFSSASKTSAIVILILACVAALTSFLDITIPKMLWGVKFNDTKSADQSQLLPKAGSEGSNNGGTSTGGTDNSGMPAAALKTSVRSSNSLNFV